MDTLLMDRSTPSLVFMSVSVPSDFVETIFSQIDWFSLQTKLNSYSFEDSHLMVVLAVLYAV